MGMPASALAEELCADNLGEYIDSMPWGQIKEDLYSRGSAVLKRMLSSEACRSLSDRYTEDSLFRSRILMERYNFGRGEYKYFAYPLPHIVSSLRKNFYSHLVPVANHWNDIMKIDIKYPAEHKDFIKRCHVAGQTRPTPLILQYGPDDYNCLHQDLYGDHVFPLQVAILLSEPEKDFNGGEFVITEQRPRMQSRPEVISLHQGDVSII